MTPGKGGAPLVVCLTTHNPPALLWRRQLASLRGQTFKDWICLVQDDASQPQAWARVQASVRGDSRFRLRRNRKRLGAFLNFEAVLKRVPSWARLVSFCDQDDRWVPYKLERTLRALEDPSVQLAYCDMKVVTAAGKLIAPTYWVGRDNQWWDLQALVLTNTVTGGGAVFRRQLLQAALPFPRQVPDLHNDGWLAMVALCQGSLAFVPEALYDYVQHGANDYGFRPAAQRRSAWNWISETIEMCRRPDDPLSDARSTEQVYRARMGRLARELLERFPGPPLTGPKRKTLQRMDRASRDLLPLAILALSRSLAQADSGEAEYYLLNAALRLAAGRLKGKPA